MVSILVTALQRTIVVVTALSFFIQND